MPIGINASNLRLPSRALLADMTIGGPAAAPPAPAPTTAPAAPLPPPPPLSVPMDAPIGAVSPAALELMTAPGLTGVARPPFTVRPDLIIPPRPPGGIPVPPAQPPPTIKTATQLARGAVAQLTAVPPDRVLQAINAIASVSDLGGAGGLMLFLERKTRIRVVLDSFAQQWDANTRNDFADAFRMPVDQTDAMDAIVSLAILNDRDLEDEIIFENTSDTSTADLTDNRRIVWQYPPAGTVLQPPYVILVAVEYRDIATAADIYKSIADQLGTYTRGTLTLKVPREVIQRLG